MKLFVLTNHDVTPEQQLSVHNELGTDEIVELPVALKNAWGTVPPEVESLSGYVRPFIEWLESEISVGDAVWVQGEWGSTVSVLDWCRSKRIRCVYSTTARVAHEEKMPDGSYKMTHVFKHVRFRDYPQSRS